MGEPEDERYPAESAMGPIQTWAEHNQLPDCAQEIAICSLIHGREEQASLLLHPAGTGTEVEFTVSLPDHADDTAARQQTARMHSELGTLRQLLEPQPARR
ncbi:hypothetical protein GCM10010349_75080 [Streptomyces flavofungini]|nr:hypothetical protein GCM10010349_75080 [Streptomyces flavofungini]